MASVLKNVLTALTPPPFNNPEEYDGWQYKWRIFVFRPAYFQTEAYLLAGLIFYVLFFFWGTSQNARRANKWLDAHLPLLTTQFSKPTLNGLTSDGYSDFFNFSTGRRAIASLHTIFTLRPRHDLLQILYQTFYSLVEVHTTYKDDLQLDFTLANGVVSDGFVWAVVKKDELRTVKDGRWDLTFTRTTDNSALPSQFSVMSEFADVTENIIKSTNIVSILQDPSILPYFRSLSITDQPRERPFTLSSSIPSEKHVILTLHCPPPSSSSATLPLVTQIFPFIDSLNKITLRPETKVKLRKVREEVEKELKEEEEKEKKEEKVQKVEDRKAAKRKAEEERIAKLSAAEQQKILERERKRSLRKQQGKVAIRK